MNNETLYKQIRNIPSYKSKAYMKWLKVKHPDKDLHHLTGAMTGIRLHDYLLLPVTRTEHLQAEKHKIDFCIDNLPKSLNYLFQYIKELENAH